MRTIPTTAVCFLLPLVACGGDDKNTAPPAGGTTTGSNGQPASALAGSSDGPLQVVYRPDGVIFRPEDPAWESIPARLVPLVPQTITLPRGGGATSVLRAQAMHDGQRLVFRLEWEDARADRSVGVSSFRDSVAVGFPVTPGETLPSPFMGDIDKAVNIWQWTADFDANERGLGSFAEAYPHTEGVWYFPQDELVSARVRAWRGFEPVIELEARGYGSLERKGTQNVSGTGVYRDGRWAVVLRRQLATGLPGDVLFRAGDATHAIFAVWDGSAGEVNGIKSITISWVPLELEPTRGNAGR